MQVDAQQGLAAIESARAAVASALAAFLLLVVSDVQVWLILRNEKTRQRERRLDQEEREDVAYGALWLEMNRMLRVSTGWQEDDLAGRALIGTFQPDDILPRDWGLSAAHFGQLGVVCAEVGGIAYATASEAAIHARTLRRLVNEYLEIRRQTLSAADLYSLTNPPPGDRIRAVEAEVKALAQQAVLQFQDALAQSPAEDRPRDRTLRASPGSYALKMRAVLD